MTKKRIGERSARVAESGNAAAPIVVDLRNLGLPVNSVADLVNKRLDYSVAVPILLEWLPNTSDPSVKEDLVRALSVKWAKPDAAPLLVREFRRVEDPSGSGIRWAIGNALAVVADDAVFDELMEIVQDQSYGIARQMVAVALGNMKDSRAVDVLVSLLDDDVVTGHAIMGLGRLKAKRARSSIERYLNHPKPWIRKEAKKAIEKIDKDSGRVD